VLLAADGLAAGTVCSATCWKKCESEQNVRSQGSYFLTDSSPHIISDKPVVAYLLNKYFAINGDNGQLMSDTMSENNAVHFHCVLKKPF